MVTFLDRLAAVATDMQVLLSTVCLGLTSAVVGNAFYQKQQFYPAVVYLTKSNASMAVIYVQFFVIVFMFGKLLRKIFLGTLRTAEFEHLLERFWYALTETCLAFTVFRDDFNPRFVALFTILLFLKSFHWLAEERVDFMERSPVLGWLFHIRVTSLLFVLTSLDYLLLMHAYNSTLVRGPTVQLVFGFEYAILLTVIISTIIKYLLHAAEMQTDAPWENKAVILLYTELIIGLMKVVLYVLFVVIMARIYALPMFVFRPMFFTIRNFKKALSDVIMSRRAIRNMNTLYPDATTEELRLSDNICIICREDMINHAKKLPCGHIFHTTCLRSWFQRQQTCPTCRLNILRTPSRNLATMPRPEEQAAPAGGVVPPLDNEPVVVNINTEATSAARSAATSAFEGMQSTPNAVSNFPGFGGLLHMIPPPPPFIMPPPLPFIAPYAVAPPPMPSDLSTISEEELRAMEGNERHHIEERLKLLNNIKLMLDAATILMSSYQIISSRYPTPTPQSSIQSVITSATPNAEKGAVTIPAAAVSDNESPSTSAAAVAKLEDVVKEALNTVKTKSKKTNQVDINKVTLEDIGGEEHVDNAARAEETNKSAIKNDEVEIDTELCELRKRRLKYLQEISKGSSSSQD